MSDTGTNGWSMPELKRAVIRLERDMDTKVGRIERLIELHEERHVSLNRMLLIVLLTALFNIGGVLLSVFLK